ncbi:aldose 1-epimerase [Nocardia sp. NPDC050406]|uniref:aldose epimerase family protein n=1 Tax=Nocardia sp. NPDC050406 TaxID=3364318 RepID=UPI0037BB5A1C
MTGDLCLTLADVTVRIAPEAGGRISGLAVDGTELLRQGEHYGCFPMAPWCGRMREGRFSVEGVEYQLPLNAPPHAIHGTARDGVWDIVEASETQAVLTRPLSAPWPFVGRVTQEVRLSEHALALEMEIVSDAERFPAQAGWHPWFLRRPRPDTPSATIDFAPTWQEVRGADYLPTGERIAPVPGPWDDCFGMPDGVDVTLEWPELLRLRVRSPQRWVVVYDLEDAAICVEPQSGPPNGLNTMPTFVEPGRPLRVQTEWSWERLTR